MHLKQFGRILRRNLWIIIIITLVGGAVGWGVANVQQPTYTASTRTLFTPANTVVAPSDIASTTAILAGRIQTYADLVGTPLILDPVIAGLGLNATPEQVAAHLTATVDDTSNVILVTASSSEAAAAAALSDAVAQSLTDRIVAMPTTVVDGVEVGVRISSQVAQPAVAPLRPSSPDIVAATTIGLAIGFAIGVLLAAVRAYTDSRVRTRDDIAEATRARVPVEGLPRRASKDIVVAAQPRSKTAEAYRRFVAEVDVLDGDGLGTVLVTSPRPQPGTQAAAANVAATLAEAGARVALVDADLRSGALAARFGFNGVKGLSEVLAGQAELIEAVHPTSVTGVSLVAAGHAAGDPGALLGSPALGAVIDDLRRSFDRVVIATPPLLDYADALMVSPKAESSIVVVSSGDTRKRELGDAYEQLERAGAAPAGVLLTAVPRAGADASWR